MSKYRTHINIPVADLDASVQFYSNVFGTEPSKLKEDYANFRLDIPPLHLALVHQPDTQSKDVTNGFEQHFGVEIMQDSELYTWKDRLVQAGVLPHLEQENVTCCYAVANKFWVHDPDGNEWEFWVRHEDAESMFEHQPDSPVESCCR